MLQVGLNGWFFEQAHVGSGQYVRSLDHALRRRDDLACLLIQPQGGDLPAPLHRWGPLSKVWWEQATVPRAARGQVDVLHYPYFASPLFTTLPTVVTIHDLIPLLFPEYSINPGVKLYNALIVAAARRADAVIAVSEHTRRDIVTHLHIPAQRIHVTYEAAGEEFRPQAEQSVAAIRQRYGLGRYIYYIGGLNRHKNVQALLAAYKQARQNLPEPPQLVIAGQAHSGNKAVFPDLRAACAALGLSWADGSQRNAADVRFLGFVAEEDKPALYAAADLFVYPSLYEGFGFCPLEAMASGAPVISSRTASLPEIVGDGGVLVDPSDIGALAEAIVGVLTNPALAGDLRRRGLRQAARFDWATMAEQTAVVYSTIVQAHQRARQP
jgi:glycosyltransferase involved in cell wall biosynthesis